MKRVESTHTSEKGKHAMTHVNRITFILMLLGTFSSARAQYVLGTTALTEGPAAGSDSVLIAGSGAWTATANDSWLHTSSSGSANATVTFTYDANTGATRTGTLTVDGQTVTVTQGASTYSAATFSTVIMSNQTTQNPMGLVSPTGVAVDGAGNVYVADANQGQIKKWTPSSGTVSTAVTGAGLAYGVAVDGSGNIFVASFYNSEEWSATTQMLTPLPTIPFVQSRDVAVDTAGNIFVADYANSVQKLNAGANSFAPVVSGLTGVTGIALDIQGNIYIADTDANAIKMWSPTTNSVTTLVSGLNAPFGVAVDSSGNVYFTDTNNNLVKKWQAATQTVSTFPLSIVFTPKGIAVDAAGNIYYANGGVGDVIAMPHAFVDIGAKAAANTGGSDALSVVLPSTTNLTGVFAPSCDQAWLTLGTITNGVIGYSFTANDTASPRTAHVTVLGQSIPVTQAGSAPNVVGTTALLKGPAAGSDTVLIGGTLPWTATANDAWLHTSSSGTGNGTAIFTCDANTGATRSGTLTIAGQTVTITQAGSTYSAATKVGTLVTGTNHPYDIALDAAGNLYIPDGTGNAILKWTAPNGPLTTLISGLNNPEGLTLDSSGNLFIADVDNSKIEKFPLPNGPLTTVLSGLGQVEDVAADRFGNIFYSDVGFKHVYEMPVGGTPAPLPFTGLSLPVGVAVDLSGNVYVTDQGSGILIKLSAADQSQTTLVTGLSTPFHVKADGSGNLYIADSNNHAVKKWTAATQTVSTLFADNTTLPFAAQVDAAGNLYIANTLSSVLELPHAFVDASAKTAASTGGSDALPAVVPSTANLAGAFAPVSDQSWLTIGSISNGVVNYSFTQNPGTSPRTAHINLLGQSIAVTQAGATPITIMSGPTATPNPAGINQPVGFTAQASGGSGTLTYSWNFGDGSPAETGSSVSHAFAAIGTYTATVTVNDANTTASGTVTVTVDPPVVGTGNDSDGDGFSDSFETAVGLNPNDATSTPTGSIITPDEVKLLTVSKASIKVTFLKTGKDSIAFNGALPVPKGFNPAGVKVYFYVAGVIKVLTLNAKGSGKLGGDSVKLTLKTKKKMVLAQNAKYSVTFAKGTFASILAANTGITNRNAKKAPVIVPFTFIFDNSVFRKSQSMSLTAKMNKTGMAK